MGSLYSLEIINTDTQKSLLLCDNYLPFLTDIVAVLTVKWHLYLQHSRSPSGLGSGVTIVLGSGLRAGDGETFPEPSMDARTLRIWAPSAQTHVQA